MISRAGAVVLALVALCACSNDKPAPTSSVTPDASGFMFVNGATAPAPPRSLVMEAGSHAWDGAFARGWGDAEGDFRWTVAKRAWVDFEFRPNAVVYELALSAAAYIPKGAADQEIAIRLNDRPVGLVTPRNGIADANITLPPGALVEGHNTLELALKWTRSPAEDGYVDTRQLGLQVRRVSFTPPSDRTSLDARAAFLQGALVTGWNTLEQNATASWVWSEGPISIMRFHVASKTAYELALTGISAPPKVDAEVWVGGKQAGVMTFERTPKTSVLVIGAALVTPGQNIIELRWSTTTHAGVDLRNLAAQISKFELAPAGTR